jgi:hypothetical protein
MTTQTPITSLEIEQELNIGLLKMVVHWVQLDLARLRDMVGTTMDDDYQRMIIDSMQSKLEKLTQRI